MEAVNGFCGSCRFFEDSEATGPKCRRRAPEPTNRLGGDGAWWPVVDAFDWCGEFEFGDSPLDRLHAAALAELKQVRAGRGR